MGRNKELRKKIAAQQRVIEDHELRIEQEQMKAHPDQGYIRSWQREISAARSKVAALTRRLKKDW